MYKVEAMQQCTDVRGKKVIVGDTVVFALVEMSVASLKVGQVKKIELHNGLHPWQQGIRIYVESDHRVRTVIGGYKLVKLDD